MRVPAETFPPGVFIAEELEARGWTTADLAARMGGRTKRDRALDKFGVDLLIAVHDPGLVLDVQTAHGLAKAFGTSAMLWLNLDAGFRWACAQGVPIAQPPEIATTGKGA